MRITQKQWGAVNGRAISLFEIDNGRGLRAMVSNYGAVLQSLFVPDRNGVATDVVLGYDTVDEYVRGESFLGACIGPIADRIPCGRYEIGGRAISIPLNAGADSMHSGPHSFSAQIWDAEMLPDGVRFHRAFGGCDLGFPYSVNMEIVYRASKTENALTLLYRAVSDEDIAISVTNHSYFNLDGAKQSAAEHIISLCADEYAETERDDDPIVTGRTIDVTGTPFDLRRPIRVGDVICRGEFREIAAARGIDNYFIIRGEGMREVGTLESAADGIRMTCKSDAPGVLVYSANWLDGERGKGGTIYDRNWAVCFETERFPNAVNHPHLRDQVILRAGERFSTATIYTFDV